MVNPSSSNGSSGSPDLSEMQAELLQSVLTEKTYPWSLDSVAENYEEDLEAAGQSLAFSDEEVSAGWQGLSAQLDRVWADVDVLALLKQKFALRLPETVLVAISDRAQQLTQSLSENAQPMAAQMIACVQETATKIGEADLQVMARPMAFAMRSSGAEELVDATVASVRQADWDELSALEQAKLSLAAARYAIAQTDTAEAQD